MIDPVVDPARHVARLIERLLTDYGPDYSGSEADYSGSEVVSADMAGMMAAVEVTLADGSVVVVEVNPA